jgi:Flp pilus assembly protein TadD
MIFVHCQRRVLWVFLLFGATVSGCAAPRGDWFHLRRESASTAMTNASRAGGSSNYSRKLAKARATEDASRLDEARSMYQKLIRDDPGKPEAFHRMGVIADRQHRFEEAQRYFSEAVRIDPTNAGVLNDLGYCFYLQGKLEKAASAITKAVCLQPGNSRFHNNLGLVYGHQGRIPEAFAEFKFGGGESDAYYNLAFVHAAQNQFEDAKACIERTLILNPSHAQALRAKDTFQRAGDDSLVAMAPFGNSRRIWVPYVEGESNEQSDSTDVANSTTVTSGGSLMPNRTAGARTRALQSRARTMMNSSLNRRQTSTLDFQAGPAVVGLSG